MESKIKYGVSLYSYQDEYFRHSMTLEECIEAVADMGADGIEIIPEMMIRDPFHVTDTFLDQWFGWMDKYGTKPIAIDAFCDERGLYRKQQREMPFDEVIALQKRYIDLCHKLGARIIRTQTTNENELRELVPYAEEKNVILGLEIHAPGHVMDARTQSFYEVMQKMGTKAMGLIPDFGIWETKPTPVIIEQCIRDGCSPKYMELAEQKKKEGFTWAQMSALLKEMQANPGEMDGVWRVFNVSYDDPQDLKQIMPAIVHVHGKFWEMTDEMQEASVDYVNPMKVLLEGGFDGYVCSEYEGGRHIQEITEVRGVEQVRRHHAMMRTVIEDWEHADACVGHQLPQGIDDKC